MDPTVALLMARDSDFDKEVRVEALCALIAWLMGGGFLPDDHTSEQTMHKINETIRELAS